MNSKPKGLLVSVSYLALAGIFGFAMAIMSIWPLTTSTNSFSRLPEAIALALRESSNDFWTILSVFWLPSLTGTVLLVSAFLLVLGNPARTRAKWIFLAPAAVILVAIVYFVVMQRDIPLLTIAILPLAAAWRSYSKSTADR